MILERTHEKETLESTTEHYKRLKDVLGRNAFAGDIESPFDFIHIAKRGVSAEVVKAFKVYFELSRESVAELLNISSPTLYRWMKAKKHLEKNYTIKLMEITDLFLYGIEVFENRENFFKWLQLPNTALGGLEPMELIEIPDGVSKVRDVKGRIEHGVYS